MLLMRACPAGTANSNDFQQKHGLGKIPTKAKKAVSLINETTFFQVIHSF
jgi:hypothetical protein